MVSDFYSCFQYRIIQHFQCFQLCRCRRFVGEEKNGQSQASFTLQDDPLNFTVSKPVSDKDPVVLAAVTVTGILHIFEHHLNGYYIFVSIL